MDYSIQAYRSIIERALAAGYEFAPFTAGVRAGLLLLRHDVDYSLEMALELARVNAGLGVRGTFFVLLRSQVYNLLSSQSREAVAGIAALGQHVALHAATRPGGADAEADLAADFGFARRDVPSMSPVFSWHNPTPELLERHLAAETVAGLINAYARAYTRDITYLSDSNMRNSVEDFLAALGLPGRPALQLLFHPLNWVAGGRTMRDVFAGTWPYVVREREQEMRQNRAYSAMLPAGMPDSALRRFADEWRRAAGGGGADGE